MFVVETIARIRRAYFVQGKGIRLICRELHVSRKVVRKVAWCMDQGAGTMSPSAVSKSGDTDVDRASQLQHAVEGMNGDGHLGCAALVLA